jgi:hypothetical protein
MKASPQPFSRRLASQIVKDHPSIVERRAGKSQGLDHGAAETHGNVEKEAEAAGVAKANFCQLARISAPP